MNWNSVGKYLAGLVMLASVYYLVLVGKVDAQVYVALITSVFAAIGVHASATLGRGAP